MGAAQSSSSSATSSTSSSVQIPVEEGLFSDTTGFTLAEAIANDSVLKRYGLTLDTAGNSATTSSSQNQQSSAATNSTAATATAIARPYGGSGRLVKTFAIRQRQGGALGRISSPASLNAATTNNSATSNTSESTAVLKAVWLLEQASSTSTEHQDSQLPRVRPTSWLDEQVAELERIRRLTAHSQHPHVAPFVYWLGGEARPVPRNIGWPNQKAKLLSAIATTSKYYGSSNASTTTDKHGMLFAPNVPLVVRPLYMIRSMVYTTLSDRLASRPFLTSTEKLWICQQLLQAVAALHDAKVVHGFITTQNVGLTSTGWVVLLDIGSYKAQTTALPDDDPSDYLYFFQPTATLSTASNSTTSTASASAPILPEQSSQGGAAGVASRPGGGTGSGEKRCYLAPERFYTPTSSSTTETTTTTTTTSSQSSSTVVRNESFSSPPPLTPAMDIFSVGCVLVELFLNGERCFDLGELMEYRRLNKNSSAGSATATTATSADIATADRAEDSDAVPQNEVAITTPPFLSQKLGKIESSAIRAACKHMLSIDAPSRLTAAAYLERLQASHQFPKASLDRLTDLAQHITTGRLPNAGEAATATSGENDATTVWNPSLGDETLAAPILTPDARIAVLAASYGHVLWECVGVRDTVGTAYFQTVLGPTLTRRDEQQPASSSSGSMPIGSNEQSMRLQELFSDVEALLKDLDSDTSKEVEPVTSLFTESRPAVGVVPPNDDGPAPEPVERSALCKSSLLIYLQFILSTIRHAQRPESKLVALQLIGRLSQYSSDEWRLQRIVPVTVSLLPDPEPLVRAASIQVLTATLASIDSFPPSDSKLFPQYIFKRVAHMVTDPALVVRLAFAQSLAVLAETSLRFLDISHAVRLYEAVGNGASGTASRDESIHRGGGNDERDAAVFGDEVTKLLDPESRVASRASLTTEASAAETASAQSDTAAPTAGKVLVHSMYGTDLTSLHDTVSRWVVHIMTDQSEHASLPKRTLLGDISRLCGFFGLEGVMSFILPQILAFLNERRDWELRSTLFQHLPAACHSIGRAATEEFVLPCVEIGLVDSEERVICHALSCLARIASMGLLSNTAVVGSTVRLDGANTTNCLLSKYGALLLYPSVDVRNGAIDAFSQICRKLGSPDCDVYAIALLQPFFRFRLQSEALLTTESLSVYLKPAWSRERVEGILQEIAVAEKNAIWSSGVWTSIGVMASDDKETGKASDKGALGDEMKDPEETSMREYLKMRSRHSTRSFPHDNSTVGLSHGIEGSAKLAQSIMFPKQTGRHAKNFLPEWYSTLRETSILSNTTISEATSIRSISMLGHVYGLTIMGPAEGTMVSIVGAADDSHGTEELSNKILDSGEAKITQGFFNGEWGSDAVLAPDLVDTSLLVTKLKALHVPPLPLNLGDPLAAPQVGMVASPKDVHLSSDWKPRLKNLLATSTTGSGHDAPVVRLAVSIDQSFFVSASHDGTCRVWDVPQIDDSAGRLESGVVYNEHSADTLAKVNDVAMIEGTYSVVSGDSSGSVHVWRVDMVTSSVQSGQGDTHHHDRPRSAGFSSVKAMEPHEGEILCVSHFNSSSASLVTFGTQKGIVHSWDLRCPDEPFKLRHSSEYGYLTSMALGSDRHWIATGTNRGFVTLWDIRFQQCVKIWRHSRRAAISRLATSTVPPPQLWESSNVSDARPFIFVASGSSECAMFDVQTGGCAECFRTVVGDSRNLNAHVEDPPKLMDVPLSRMGHLTNMDGDVVSPGAIAPINCMVGSIGASNQSYLITGGGDCRIRFWDFTSPSKCFVLSDQSQTQPRQSFERIDFAGPCRLMLCRQSQSFGLRDVGGKKTVPGLNRPEQFHTDAIQDIKVLNNSGIISSSRDSTVKVWW